MGKLAWVGRDFPISMIEAFRAIGMPDLDDCWPWGGRIGANGYGLFVLNGQSSNVHRLSYASYRGEPGAKMVRHTCDNPPCWRPGHLVLGTQADNMNDAAERDRVAWGNRRAIKLDRQMAREIFVRYHAGESCTDLMESFGIASSATIHKIATRRLWRRDTEDLSSGQLTRTDRSRRGEAHPMVKTTMAMVEEIRRRVLAGEPRARMRDEYGLSKTQIQRIITGASWT